MPFNNTIFQMKLHDFDCKQVVVQAQKDSYLDEKLMTINVQCYRYF